jgi:hypothetical protein
VSIPITFKLIWTVGSFLLGHWMKDSNDKWHQGTMLCFVHNRRWYDWASCWNFATFILFSLFEQYHKAICRHVKVFFSRIKGGPWRTADRVCQVHPCWHRYKANLLVKHIDKIMWASSSKDMKILQNTNTPLWFVVNYNCSYVVTGR